ncbi:DUF4167 domain-containing protein [uncultured Hoeflea sp.]|uniref:DUF4167 domain-containing protein n=1 Tax=uncultured Hoeflea sp. TaxID=538666 RepID=UPI00260C5201|nr:DUF4167 domain-containing protein [uncultured Hoeflea sp.]
MRPGQQNKRGRGRSGNNGGGNRKGQNPLSRTYDSSGPDVKIRGTAQHVAEKYMNLARDAQSSGDRVMAENYLQHAEHYNRIILTAQAQMQERFQKDETQSQNRDAQDQDDDDRDGAEGETENRAQDQRGERSDRSDRQPRQERSPRRERPERQPRQANQDGEQPNSPAYDPDAPQPVIEGVPAEVAIGQETPSEETAPAPRRRGRPRRVRTEEGAETGAADKDKPAASAPEPAAAD